MIDYALLGKRIAKYRKEKSYTQAVLAEKADISNEKSRKAVDALLTASAGTDSKIDSAVQYILSQCGDITPLALQKALYYIQGFHYAFYKTFLFSEDCQAWVHGPVYRNIYVQYKNYRFDPIKKSAAFDASVFSASEKSICDSVIHNLCCYSGKILEAFTHNETPWLTARGSLPVTEPSDRIIEKALIGSYFEAVKEKYHMVNPGDMKSYAQDMFLQSQY